MSGLLLAHPPQPARAALVATGVNDRQTVKHSRPTVIPAPGVLANDLNLLGGSSAILVSGVSHGTLSLRSDGGYTYTPAAGYLGTDTFRYRPSGLLSTAATVTITITNATPVARPDAYSGAAGTSVVVGAPGVLGNDSDADGDPLVTELLGGGSGSLNLHPNGGLSYTPGGGFSGMATFSYRVSDGMSWSAATSVTFTIAAPPPTPSPTPAPTPSPAPTTTPAPTVTPRPTSTPIVPLPTPSLPLPSLPLPTLPLPSLPQPGSSAPATPSPSRSPGATASPTSSATTAPGQSGDDESTPSPSADATPSAGSGGGGGPAAPSTGAGSDDPGARFPSIAFDERRLDLAGQSVGLFGGIEIWAVPAATIALPGLLVLIWVALQAAGAIAWIPAVRRLHGKDEPRRRVRVRTP